MTHQNETRWERARRLRKAQNLTQEEVAAEIKIHRNTLRRWENGKGDPSPEDLGKWAKALGVERVVLLDKPNDADGSDPGPWADSLIGYVEVSIRLQEVAETGAPNLSELVTGAYGAAIINGWPSEEFAKLDQWRDRLLREYKFQVVSRGEHERGWRSRDLRVGLRTAIARREIEMTWDDDDLEDAKGVFTQEWITEFREKLRKEDEADPEGVRARRTEARRQFAALRIAEARYLGDPPTQSPEGTPVVGAAQGSTTLEDATQLLEADDAIQEDRKKRPVRKRARGDPRSRA